jgi:hypothetical protein
MIFDHDISLATPNDIPCILALQEPNLPDSGGTRVNFSLLGNSAQR